MQNAMNVDLQSSLQDVLDRWIHFAPCPGANLTIIDSKFGMWSGSTGYADVDSLVNALPKC